MNMKHPLALLLAAALAAPAALAADPGPADDAAPAAPAAPAAAPSTPFATCPSQRQWKVAVVEAGSLNDYQDTFRHLVAALSGERVISSRINLPEGFRFDRGNNWEQLVDLTAGDCVRFAPQGLYNGGWDEATRAANATALAERLAKPGEIDLVIAFGEAAAQDLSLPSIDVPVMVVGGVQLEDERGLGRDLPLVHVQVAAGRREAEVREFHSIFGFRSLGVLTAGPERSLDFLAPLSGELSFNVTRCEVTGATPAERKASYKSCVTELLASSDAVYLDATYGESLRELQIVLAPLYARHVPTFSQLGPIEVEHGALLSLANADLSELGAFEARVLQEIVSGRTPAKIERHFKVPVRLALNLEVAMRTGLEPSFETLVKCDQVFDAIKVAP
ncbi:MAG: hypothetical protein K6A65_04375 [Succinivibrionaceae bacterium]|nr:hypothetical protein [Succinivibrionaceae bacterium]